MDFGGHRRVSRLRVLVGKGRARLGKTIGRVTIDVGSMAVCDMVWMEKRYSRKEKAGAIQRLVRREKDGMYGVMRLILDDDSRHLYACTLPGLGDGEYPVFELQRNGKVVGLEIVFMGKEVPDWRTWLKAKRVGR